MLLLLQGPNRCSEGVFFGYHVAPIAVMIILIIIVIATVTVNIFIVSNIIINKSTIAGQTSLKHWDTRATGSGRQESVPMNGTVTAAMCFLRRDDVAKMWTFSKS